MVLSKEDFNNRLKELIGDDTSDKSIQLLEDMTDTYNDLVSKSSDSEDWKAKFEENDKQWRQKYTDRFFGDGKEDVKEDKPATPPSELEPETFDELFTDLQH